ncbi:tripartite tricarboxylate transporter substrate binding protein [Verticiella sediminum]|uniref:Tripartite tricarboxylate transporter substrate binding protein n=1 Tax=Verticiella sediminum TaxID=1247510 RepID=A0A556AGL5_9BURK|nr:tripartite tricarboxylate transporter substrate binding protein [Verticiella sediminum]TSH92038.1 tripartite tricarboxylate transporter substrate binding protein [Verticiella sediminum]
MKKRWMGCLALFAAALIAANPARAAWPERPITLIVPYTPGTGIDQVARQLSVRLPERLGQAVIVENVAGASGNIGSERVARADPDGYTLLVQVNTLVMNRSLYKTLPYDPVKDFTPVALTSFGTLLLVTNPKVQQAETLQQMLDDAKAQPGALTYATPGVGTPHHLAMALLQQKTGVELLHVPFKGTSGAVTDLLGGRLDYMFLPVHVALPHIQSGRLKALATGSDERLPQLPDVPTLAEAGVDTGNIDMWYGVLAPQGTPAEIVERLNASINEALESPEIAKAFEAQGMVPATSTPAAFAERVATDADRWAEVVRTGNITAD